MFSYSVSATASPAFRSLHALIESRWSLALGFIWGFAEATAFFIVPDVYLGLVTLLNWRRGMGAVLAAVTGALAGGTLMYFVAQADPQGVIDFLGQIPLISSDMIKATGERLRSGGLMGMLNDPLRGVPFKVYAAQAGTLGLPILSFLLMTIPARLARFLPAVLVCSAFGVRARTFVEERTHLMLLGYTAVWTVIYLAYFLLVR
jgi:membrane protein YqaA with SNARE-associated domain